MRHVINKAVNNYPDSLPPSLPMIATGGTRRLSGGVGLVWSFLYFAMISMTVAKFCGPWSCTR